MDGLKDLSLVPADEKIKAFMTYLSELKKWNKAYNLTGLKTDEEIIVKHFLDSLLYLKALPEGEISLMDVGSGAGFPGIPLKIMRPEITAHLLEPSRKKANFLIHLIKTLRVDRTEVIGTRIEEVKSLCVDVAVTRALFGVKEFYRKAYPHLLEGGRIVLSKGPKVTEELSKIRDLEYELLSLRLPVSNIKRFIVVIMKKPAGESVAKGDPPPVIRADTPAHDACVNIECRLRKAGCRGFEGCPGYKARS
jgi:16S rRNA (guanine527-N7)-methyltransferase